MLSAKWVEKKKVVMKFNTVPWGKDFWKRSDPGTTFQEECNFIEVEGS